MVGGLRVCPMRFTPECLGILLLTTVLSPGSAGGALAWIKTGEPTNYWTSLAFSADGSKFFATTDEGLISQGGIYASSDAGATWHLTTAPKAQYQGVACSTNGERVVA